MDAKAAMTCEQKLDAACKEAAHYRDLCIRRTMQLDEALDALWPFTTGMEFNDHDDATLVNKPMTLGEIRRAKAVHDKTRGIA